MIGVVIGLDILYFQGLVTRALVLRLAINFIGIVNC